MEYVAIFPIDEVLYFPQLLDTCASYDWKNDFNIHCHFIQLEVTFHSKVFGSHSLQLHSTKVKLKQKLEL